MHELNNGIMKTEKIKLGDITLLFFENPKLDIFPLNVNGGKYLLIIPSVYPEDSKYFNEGKQVIRKGNLNERQKVILDLLFSMISMRVGVDENNQLYYEDQNGNKYTPSEVPLSFNVISSIFIPLLVLETPSLIFLKNPEAYLHPSQQVYLATILPVVAKMGYHLIISSNSDIFCITLAQFVVQKPKKRDIKKFFKAIHVGEEGIEEVVKMVVEAVQNIKIKVYEMKIDGRMKELKIEKLLSEGVPVITEVTDALLGWALHLAMKRVVKQQSF